MNKRDFDQMLQNALEMKEKAQKFIDFAKLHGGGDGGIEGQEDLESVKVEDPPNDDNIGGPGGMMSIVMGLKNRRGASEG